MEQKTETMRERIRKGAEDLYLRYGLRSVTMDDVAKDLSVSKKTIYQFFRDKHELVQCVMLEHQCRTEDVLQGISQEAHDAIEEFILISIMLQKMFANMNPVVLYDLQKYHPDAWHVFLEHRDSCIEKTILHNLQWGQRDGLYRDDAHPAILARMRIEQAMLAFDSSAFPHDTYSLVEVQTQFLLHFIHGVVSPRGYELLQTYKAKYNIRTHGKP
ncbi:DNA-binding transcriptional regulator, AcrR family [Catalinimonas alkaloidigena]|uniref:DNA-binding transcriptional regulator, AcrR family n=1 Tax=Catalinimonas alkaloidigena TaxID=1075417 RepID=A0A1G9PJJ7_9BACT|nr:TetR/AcrR family transcriptional regulator [Catalinimonas alkaloidigena]SDL98387.1 DNA-binding transcriptional regulator, AcrR family [Catalinimonas alkaloidigena]